MIKERRVRRVMFNDLALNLGKIKFHGLLDSFNDKNMR